MLDRKHPMFSRWRQMHVAAYGGYAQGWRAIGATVPVICERWRGVNVSPGELGFANYVADLGLPPFRGAVLGRDDLRRDWEPGNLTWRTRGEIHRLNRERPLEWRNWMSPEKAAEVDRILIENALEVAKSVDI